MIGARTRSFVLFRILIVAGLMLSVAVVEVGPYSSPAFASGSNGTTAWQSGSFVVNTKNLYSRSDVVLGRPPTQNTQAIPLGNGTLGAAVWAANGLTAQLNRGDTFPGKSPGQVVIPGLAGMTNAANYAGRLGLYDAQYVQAGNGMTATAYVRADADQFVVEVTGADPNVTQNVDVKLWSGRSPTVFASGATAALGETFTDPTSGRTFGSLAAVTVAGQNVVASTVDPLTARVSFKPNSDGTFRVVVGSPSYSGASTVADAAAAALNGATAGTAATFAAGHLQWWHQFWATASPMKITSGDGSGEYIENQRALGLYTTAASERGPLPTTHGAVASLFSAFQDASDWNADAYWHYNLRMEAAANLAANMTSFNNPYFNLYESNFSTLQANTAALMPGSSGICVPETMGFDGSGVFYNSHACDSSAVSNYTAHILSSGPEVAFNMWLQYLYTGDQNFLRTSYPFMASVAKFYLWRLDAVGADGKRHLAHANSLEDLWDVTDPTADVAAMKALFPIIATLAAAQGTSPDTALAAQINAAVPQIPNLNTTTRNGKTVLAWSAPTSETSHNAQNPDLEPVWPWGLYGLGSTSSDLTLAQDTFNNRVYPQAYDWGMDGTWAARLGLSSSVKALVIAGTEQFQIFSNGFSQYAGSSTSNFYSEWQHVVTTDLQEALVQSYDGVVRVPAAWPSGWDVDGALQIEGGHQVSVQVRNGVPATVGIKAASTVTAGFNNSVVLANPWPDQTINAIDGTTGNQIVAPTSGATITLPMTSGGSVVVQRTAVPLSSFTFAAVDGVAATSAKHLGSRSIGIDGPAPTPVGPLLLDWTPTAGQTVTDVSGNHLDGSVVGGTAAYSTGPNGPSLVLSGAQYVSAPAALPSTSAFSAEVEVRVDGSGSYRRLLDDIPIGGGGSSGFLLDLNPSNQVRFIGAGVVEQTTVSVSTGVFHHVAATVSAAGLMTVYLDGVSSWSAQITPAPIGASSAQTPRFGADQNGASNLLGAFARARLYSTTLTAAQVAADARAENASGAETCPSTADSGILLDWNPASGNQVSDASGYRRDGFTHATASYTQGPEGPAVSLSSGNFLTSGAQVNLGPISALTAEAEVNVTGSGSYRRLVDYIPAGGNGSVGFLVDLTPTNQVRFIGAGISVTTGAVVPTGVFTDVAVTLTSGGVLTVYENGQQSWTGQQAVAAFGGCAGLQLRFGADRNGASTLTGSVGRVRLWGQALTSTQIAANVAAPLTEQCRASVGTGPLLDWSPSSGSTIADASTYFRPATIIGTPTYGSDTKGTTLSISVNQYVQSSLKVNLGAPLSALTAVAHVSVTGSGTYQRLFDYIPAGGNGSVGFLVDLTPTNQVRFIGAGISVTTGAVVPTGVFTDVAVTLTPGGVLTVYENGQQSWTGQQAASAFGGCAGLQLRFGADRNGANALTGSVGRIRLWPRALSATEISSL